MLLALPVWLTHGWMHVKLGFVVLLSAYHFWCAGLVRQFARDEIRHSHRWYRWFNEFPALVLLVVVVLVVLKPF